jgi:arsenate reductase
MWAAMGKRTATTIAAPEEIKKHPEAGAVPAKIKAAAGTAAERARAAAMDKPKVAFICTHNSCRSQMAEAIAGRLAPGAMEPFSAGTEPKKEINPDAVRCIGRLYGFDMKAAGQRPKAISELPAVDIVVTMGCGVQCPWLPSRHREDWGIEDPTGGDDGRFDAAAEILRAKVLDLRNRITEGHI